MNKHYNIIISLIVALQLFATPLASQNNQCSEILNRVIKEYNNSKGIISNFNIRTLSNGYESKIDGKISLKGEMFMFNTAEMECGYDGETLWTFLKSSNEINLSIPDKEEIISINPYLLLKNYDSRFNCKFKEKKGDLVTLHLSPKSKDDNISCVVIVMNSKLLYPEKIEIETNDNSKTVITISAYNSKSNFDNSIFTFDEKRYKNVEIIDLR